MYKGPIDCIYRDRQIATVQEVTDNEARKLIKGIQDELEEYAVRACVEVGIEIDRDELLKALAYDRGQYDKGYRDGLAEIIKCYECKWFTTDEHGIWRCRNYRGLFLPKPSNFCSYGERKQESESHDD